MPTVEVRKNVMISFGGGADTFTCPINIDFIPDELIVRGITRWNGGSAQWLTVIATDLVQDRYLGFYNEAATDSSAIGATFTIGKQVKGTYTFQILEILTGVNQYSLKSLAGDVCIHLEFVKYKGKKY